MFAGMVPVSLSGSTRVAGVAYKFWSRFHSKQKLRGDSAGLFRIAADERLHPAAQYVMIDDKLRVLAAMKAIWGNRLTTVFPRQGRYALDPLAIATYPPADITVERIGDLLDHDFRPR